jgi:predicted DNA-binding transcriptional regulator AlpA
MTRRAQQQQAELATVGLAPRGLSRSQAAAYIGISERKFDALVADKRMPSPKRIDARTVWDRVALDAAFARLPNVHTDADDKTADQHDAWTSPAV